jgi:PAS domain S-box-containing protein
VEFLKRVFSSGDFMPHGYCYLWNAGLIWLHVLSDAIIFLAYMTIPVTLLYLARHRKDLPFNWMFACFGVFIVACGLTHAMEIWNLWHAAYWLAGAIKAVTAVASIGTAALLIRLAPLAIALPSVSDMRDANEETSRQAEKIAAEEAKFRGIVESAPDAMVISDAQGRIVLVNAETERLFRYWRQDLIGQSVDVLVPERFRKTHPAHRSNYTVQPKTRAMGAGIELYGLRRDGTEFPVEISLSPLDTPGGMLVSSAIRDVTEQRRTQQLLRNANLELESRVAERTANLESAKKELEKMVAQQERAEEEVRQLNQDLENRVRIRTSELQAAVQELALEMAERKRAERALQEQAAKLRDSAALLELAHDAIFVRDMSARIIYWNHGAEQLYGWAREEAAGRISHDLLATKFPESLDDTLADLLRDGKWEGELLHRRKDGTWIAAASRWSLQRNEKGKPVAILEINNDITARKNAEEIARKSQESVRQLNDDLMRRTAELETSNHELESFSYSVSHDLRAPLRHIDGFARILMEEHGAHLGPDAVRYVQKVIDGAAQMGRLVEDLLNLARVGRTGPKRRDVDLNDLLHHVVTDLSADLGSRKISWEIASLPVTNCDPGLMRIVLTNLLANALKFTRQCETSRIEVATCVVGGDESFFVRDNGVGFDPKYADKLFGVFQRLHRAEEFEGTGIGLATVHRIIRNHGGRIWADSHPGQGATFYFTLGYPRAAARVEEAPSEVSRA